MKQALLVVSLMFLAWIPAPAKDQVQDLEAIRAQRDPKKRARLAWDFAASRLDAAKKLYAGGDWSGTQHALSEMADGVELGHAALKETGERPRRSKHYKRGELETQELLRRLDDFLRAMSVEDRTAAEDVRKRVDAVHQTLLLGVMGQEPQKSAKEKP